jgi:hypothetical protein
LVIYLEGKVFVEDFLVFDENADDKFFEFLVVVIVILNVVQNGLAPFFDCCEELACFQ